LKHLGLMPTEKTSKKSQFMAHIAQESKKWAGNEKARVRSKKFDGRAMDFEAGRATKFRCYGCGTTLQHEAVVSEEKTIRKGQTVLKQKVNTKPLTCYRVICLQMKEPHGGLSKHEIPICAECAIEVRAFSQEELELLYISTIEANCFEIYKSGAQPGDFEEGTDPFEKERSYITYMMTREVTGEIMYVRGLPGGIESGALANGHGKGIEAHRQPS